MKTETYKKFLEQMTKIRKECCVDNETAKKDPTRYTTYTLQFPYSRKAQVSYDREKLKKYESTFRQMFTELPQRKVGSVRTVGALDLVNDDVGKEPDVQKRMKTITQQHNLAELFLKMSTEFRNIRCYC